MKQIVQIKDFDANAHFSYESWVKPQISRLKRASAHFPFSMDLNIEAMEVHLETQANYFIRHWYRMSVKERLLDHIGIYYNDAFWDFQHGGKYEKKHSHYPVLKRMRELAKGGKELDALALASRHQGDETFPINLEGGRWEDFIF